eukprot:TRINITY_DN7381_c0_g1_i1.p1 TRINITY_DN7381_c0_g1~~TRINITY_DN7381_c0_g1_i1.p1  ORF type:complete len:246 (-),score=48.08 TRINITY_DN7381_c0_g1_i1:254-931(-)
MAEPSAMQTYKALVIGATGATGKSLVANLLKSPTVSKVTILVRRKATDLFQASDKLEEHVINMDEMESHAAAFKDHDVSYCCLGTTRKDAGSAEAFRKVDLEYASVFTRLSKEAGVSHFHLVSSVGANKNSWFLYPQTKGEIEQYVQDQKFKVTSIWRPGLLDRGDAARTVEKIASVFMGSISVETVARAMMLQEEQDRAKGNLEGEVRIFENNQIKKIATQWKD